MVNSSKKFNRIIKQLRKEHRQYWWDKFYAMELNVYMVFYRAKGVR